ncbi:TfoX/Sxy family protein [Rhodocista pekingensis]|uniref:TfoX/Sxy family protein n=1 Tax=Rhodocista pekingensis TaxID=201185 RepID=A0ABW2KVL1_9PROT
MPVSRDYLDHVLELLSPLGPVKARAMFGGCSLSLDGASFALIADDVLYLKADAQNRPAFEAAGCRPFAPFEDRPQQTMSYYPPPETAFDDADELMAWARPAVSAALRARAAKKPARPKKRTPA